MILTVTPNPSIDLLFEADRLTWDDANRVEMPRRRAGGQGINLTRAARVLGADSIALALFRGRAGQELRSLLDEDGARYIAVPASGETRLFVAVREQSSGRSLLVNPRGEPLTAHDRTQLITRIEAACTQLNPSWVVCSGSVPAGLGDDFYAEVSGIAHARSARFIADCDGEALKLAVRAGCDLIAPNQHEAGRLVDSTITTIDDAARAARALLKTTPRVLIKLGEMGAIITDANGCWHAQGRSIDRGSAVGAGDAFLAGFLAAEGKGATPPEALRRAVAAGSAVLLSSGGSLLTRNDYEMLLAEVEVRSVGD